MSACVDAVVMFVGGDKWGQRQWRSGHGEHRADGHLYQGKSNHRKGNLRLKKKAEMKRRLHVYKALTLQVFSQILHT